MSANPHYPRLFTPLRLGAVTLPNRLIMGSMHTGLEAIEGGLDRLADFYRERAAAGLIVTGGFAPNQAGNLKAHPAVMASNDDARRHRVIPQAVHQAGGRILLQVLHSGRYGYHGDIVAPSAVRAPINAVTPRALTGTEIERTIEDFGRAAALAREAGYDGVEIMGSEGYLITQFLAPRTNQREDEWGGSLANRMRFAEAVVRRSRQRTGDDFIILFRISALDLVDGGLTGAETVAVARAIEAAGASMLSSGIGWHEARIPTIAQAVPDGGFAWATRPIKQAVGIPVAASNRINRPELAEQILAAGQADLVAMARPFLADEHFVEKAAAGDRKGINICIACNQACLDQYFVDVPISCLVNPRAAREAEFTSEPALRPRRVAVLGGGPAGLAAAVTAAERGHKVTLYEASGELGGQFNLAKRIPGKAVFAASIDYFADRLRRAGVEVRLGQRVDARGLRAAGHDEVVLATGVSPRRPDIPGIDHRSVCSYVDLLTGRVSAGPRVAIVGAGGIGFDVALYLLEGGHQAHLQPAAFAAYWGLDQQLTGSGGLAASGAPTSPPPHAITMLKRQAGPFGTGLGKTTGWVHRAVLARHGVKSIAGVTYQGIDDAGVHVLLDGKPQCLAADTVVICAGQEPLRDLEPVAHAGAAPLHVIGGARLATELDAKRAIEEGVRLAMRL